MAKGRTVRKGDEVYLPRREIWVTVVRKLRPNSYGGAVALGWDEETDKRYRIFANDEYKIRRG